MSHPEDAEPNAGIAVVGMSLRFPGASDPEAFWRNLAQGVESSTTFGRQELEAAGVPPAVLDDPAYVPAGFPIADIDRFDAAFFDLTPREAEVLDPQHRLFLECSWEALEDAGCDPFGFGGSIGVFGGVFMSTYLYYNLFPQRRLAESLGELVIRHGNEKDYLATRVSYKLNLKGPSVTVQTACSTALVAVHLACQSLLAGECDMALAGGVSLRVPQRVGYLYQPGGILSPDGSCRAFSADAQGTVFGHGLGVVALKRLAEAVADGDTIHAVILGSAVNNDGAQKVGFTAPSVEGQVEVIAEAIGVAGVEPDTITYVETHGTGTALGDPIEIEALSRAFRAKSSRRGFCAIGSVKTNIGHLSSAAGVAGLIKVVLALEHGMIPPSLHFEQPNGKIDFEGSPFRVATRLAPWVSDAAPRRAGLSSFGMGGTNAHAVLEEAPPAEPGGPSRSLQVLLLSARTPTALERQTEALAARLAEPAGVDLADAAYTLATGRHAFEHRRALVCRDRAEAAGLLAGLDAERVLTSPVRPGHRPVLFLFPGQGNQYAGMAAELRREEPFFEEQIGRCAELLAPHLGLDLRRHLARREEVGAGDAAALDETWLAQPALFAVEYALARLWMEWGVAPEGMIGHSIGELVAASIAGVFSLEDALALVAARGRLMQAMPTGAMLAVALGEAELADRLDGGLALAAVNGPALAVASGPTADVERLSERLAAEGVTCRRLHTSHAFHSPLMDPVVEPLTELVRQMRREPPRIPFVSNLTGRWIEPGEATDPAYWGEHLRRTVRFGDGLETLFAEASWVAVEVGPGRSLGEAAKRRRDGGIVVAGTSLPHPREPQPDLPVLLTTLSRLWLAGVAVDWRAFYGGQRRRRIRLPTYPFERRRFWVDAPAARGQGAERSGAERPSPRASSLLSAPVWKQAPAARPVAPPADAEERWLLVGGEPEVGEGLAERLAGLGRRVVAACPADRLAELGPGRYGLDPRRPADHQALLERLRAEGAMPSKIVHLGALAGGRRGSQGAGPGKGWEAGFSSLLALAQGLAAARDGAPLRLDVVSADLTSVAGGEALAAEAATLLGLARVIPHELPGVACRSVDLALGRPAALGGADLDRLAAELVRPAAEPVVALRGPHRWIQVLEPLEGSLPGGTPEPRPGRVYLIAGGLRGPGLAAAEALAAPGARLVLIDAPAPELHAARLATRGNGERPAAPNDGARARLEGLAAAGAEVVRLALDAGDEGAWGRALEAVLERSGAPDGVVYAVDGFVPTPLASLAAADAARALLPPLAGARLLLDRLAGADLEFLVFSSSFHSLVGGAGQALNAAASAALDGLAHERLTAEAGPALAIDWGLSPWSLGREEDGGGESPGEGEPLAELLVAWGLPRATALAAWRHLPRARLGQVVVSPHDPREVIARHDAALAAAAAARNGDRPAAAESREEPREAPSRPNLGTSFVAPGSDLEHRIAAVWEELLGIRPVGIRDSFFELGGSSLLGIQLAAELKRELGLEVTVGTLFECPTVAALAQRLEAGQGDAAPPAEGDDRGERRRARSQARRRGARTEDEASEEGPP